MHQKLWLKIYVGLTVLACIPIFFFREIASFRDFVFSSNSYNFQFKPLLFTSWVDLALNTFSSLGLPANLFWTGFFASIFGISLVGSFIYLTKIQTLINSNSKSNQWLVALISTLYTFNNYTLERFLMGQYTILLGQALFLPILYFFFQNWNSFFKTKNWLILAGSFLILSSINTHHAVFLLYLQAIFLVIFICQSLVKIVKKQSISWSKYLNSLPFLPGMVLLYFKHRSDASGSFYLQSLARNPALQTQIIQNFSLKSVGVDFFWIKAVTGSSSWLSPFVETQNIVKSMSFVSIFSIYFNDLLAFGLVIFVIFLIWFRIEKDIFLVGEKIWNKFNSKRVQDIFTNSESTISNNYPNLSWIFLVILLLALTLNFGYSTPFWQNINSWFYATPYAYIYREPGKFYSLFLLLLAVFLVITNYKLTFWQKKLQHNCLLFFVVSSFLPFFWLSSNLNYISYPQIYTQLSQSCRHEDKILFLPLDNYLITGYSPNVFISNELSKLISCQVYTSTFSTLVDQNTGQNLVLTANDQDLEINQILQKLSQNNYQQQDFLEFKKLITELKITHLAVETQQASSDWIKFNQELPKYFKLQKQETTLWLYKV